METIINAMVNLKHRCKTRVNSGIAAISESENAKVV